MTLFLDPTNKFKVHESIEDLPEHLIPIPKGAMLGTTWEYDKLLKGQVIFYKEKNGEILARGSNEDKWTETMWRSLDSIKQYPIEDPSMNIVWEAIPDSLEYADFLNLKTMQVQTLPSHAGDDPNSGLYLIPLNINYIYEGNSNTLLFSNIALYGISPSIWERNQEDEEPQCYPVYAGYLDSQNNYALTLKSSEDTIPDHFIKIPEGADTFIVFDSGTQYFWKHTFEGSFFMGCGQNIDEYPTWEFMHKTAEEYLAEFEPHNRPKIVWQDQSDQSVGCIDSSKATSSEPVKVTISRNAPDIADAALQHIRDRAATYDSPEGERSALKTAQAFNAVTGKDITEAEVFLLLQILKDVRQWQKTDYHQDSAEDAIAYATLKAEALERSF